MARNQKQQREASEFEERVVYINRVSKTVKGGRWRRQGQRRRWHGQVR